MNTRIRWVVNEGRHGGFCREWVILAWKSGSLFYFMKSGVISCILNICCDDVGYVVVDFKWFFWDDKRRVCNRGEVRIFIFHATLIIEGEANGYLILFLLRGLLLYLRWLTCDFIEHIHITVVYQITFLRRGDWAVCLTIRRWSSVQAVFHETIVANLLLIRDVRASQWTLIHEIGLRIRIIWCF